MNVNLSTLSRTELWQLSRKQYSDGNYKSALATSTVLTDHSSVDSELSELLAFINCKLEIWDKALDWARHMIKQDAQDARGYLCTGKILTKMGRKKRAIAIYDIGLSKIRQNDPNLKKLMSVRDAATLVQVSPNLKDPLTVLPTELALEIFHLAGFGATVKSRRVSKSWNGFLTAWPELWTTLELPEHGQVRSKFVKNCVKYSQYKLQHAHLGHFSDMKTIVAILKCCKLKSLSFSANSRLPIDVSRDLIRYLRDSASLEALTVPFISDQDCIAGSLYKLPNLKECRFSNVLSSAPFEFPGNEQFLHSSLKVFECWGALSSAQWTPLLPKFSSVITLFNVTNTY
jgi:F-box/TPR repeat protein Pof3